MNKVYLLMQVKRLNRDNTIDSFVRAAYKTPESAICAMECIILRNASFGIQENFFISETEVND